MFIETDTQGVDMPHNDPLAIELDIIYFSVTHVLIDTGNSVD